MVSQMTCKDPKKAQEKGVGVGACAQISEYNQWFSSPSFIIVSFFSLIKLSDIREVTAVNFLSVTYISKIWKQIYSQKRLCIINI